MIVCWIPRGHLIPTGRAAHRPRRAGLLESTIVLALGELVGKPKCGTEKNAGRDHRDYAPFVLAARGGFKWGCPWPIVCPTCPAPKRLPAIEELGSEPSPAKAPPVPGEPTPANALPQTVHDSNGPQAKPPNLSNLNLPCRAKFQTIQFPILYRVKNQLHHLVPLTPIRCRARPTQEKSLPQELASRTAQVHFASRISLGNSRS